MSNILRRHEQNPLGTRVVIRRPSERQAPSQLHSQSPSPSPSPSPPPPDDDLRQSIPCYEKIVNYLGILLKNAIQDAPQELFNGLHTPEDIWKEFRRQLAQYARMQHPFNTAADDDISPFEYWNNLSHHNDSKLLAYIAIKIYSICPNSMGEERTVSNFSKLNQADRASLKAATIVGMTRIKQNIRRVKGYVKQKEKGGIPVKFRDLSEFTASVASLKHVSDAHSQSSAAGDTEASPLDIDGPTESEPNPITENGDKSSATDDVDPLDLLLKGLEEHEAAAFTGRQDMFDVEAGCSMLEDGDAADLADPSLLDLLSDTPISGAMHADRDLHAPRAQRKANTKFQKKKFDPSCIEFVLD